jgi:catechol 2,3-dioxygenase-like lactoylglutathione lyase family enzyme
MFDHVTIRVSDGEASERFYETVLGAIGIAKSGSTGEFGDGCPEFAEWGDFSLATGDAPTTGLHVAFSAESRDEVDAFWDRGIEGGYVGDGEPGVRPHYRSDYYGAFLLDPDGNSVEAVTHGGVNRQGNIDHLWIGVPDLDAARAFYEAVSPYSGYPLLWEHPDRVHFGAMGSHFALVADSRPATQNLHLAFPADSNETVDAFHAAATAAGYADNGEPGERPQYHDGYYAAFVFDPAGANVEVVNHNRH